MIELEGVKHQSDRVVSIDAFRGITIFLMILFNDIARIKDTPAWLHHMPWNVEGMNVPDLIFPAFLFIVGMSIPLAMDKAIGKGKSIAGILGHIGARSAGLIFIGVLMVNRMELNPSLAGMSVNMWSFLFFLSVVFFWNVCPEKQGWKSKVFAILKWISLGVLVYLVVIYRSGAPENASWIKTSYWGILGLIGWAYLVSSMGYLCFRRNIELMVMLFALLVAVRIGESSGTLPRIWLLKSMNMYIDLGAHIAGTATIAVAGVIVGMFLRRESKDLTAKRLFKWAAIFSLLVIVEGYCLKKFGINKAGAKIAWALYSTGICVMLFALTHYVVDILKFSGWTKYVMPAGKNPLLAYLLPPLILPLLALLGLPILDCHIEWGVAGISISIVFTILIIWLTALLSKAGVSLRL